MSRTSQITATVFVLASPMFGWTFWLWIGQQHMISLSNFRRLEIGMTESQVEEIIGVPRWEVKPKNPQWIDLEGFGDIALMPSEWWGEEGVIQIWYDNGRVSRQRFIKHRCEIVTFSLFDRFLNLIGVHAE